MLPNRRTTSCWSWSSRVGQRLELFYYERIETPAGECYYLRLTWLVAGLIRGLTGAAMAAILIIFLSARSSQRTPTRIELKALESRPLDLKHPDHQADAADPAATDPAAR